MPSRRDQITEFVPGAGGVVTGTKGYQLRPDQAVYGQDFRIRGGFPSERAGYNFAGIQNAFGSAGSGDWYRAAWVGDFFGGSEKMLACSGSGELSDVTSGSAKAITIDSGFAPGSGWFRPRLYYDGELLLCPSEGLSPILRWSGNNETDHPRAGANGSVTMFDGESYLEGSGSPAWLTGRAMYPGSYVWFWSATQGGQTRVSEVESDTRAATYNPTGGTGSARAIEAIPHYGTIALRVEVARSGRVSVSGTSLTGKSTVFQNGSGREAALRYADAVVATDGSNDAFDAIVSSISSDVAATLISSGTTITDKGYKALRPFAGKDIELWQGRLWCICSFDKRRVFLTPPGPNLDNGWNGIDSLTAAPWAARTAKFVDVPHPAHEGELQFLAGTEFGLLVVGENDVHRIIGEYPSIAVEPIPGAAGCISIDASIRWRGDAYWCSRQGVHGFRDGEYDTLTEGRDRDRTQEWRNLLAAMEALGDIYFAMGVVDDHLLVSFSSADGSIARTWVYDLRLNRWCGDHTLGSILSYALPNRSSPQDAPSEQLYGTTQDRNQIGQYGQAFEVEPSAKATVSTGTYGNMKIGVPWAAITRSPGQRGRITGLRLSGAMTAPSPPVSGLRARVTRSADVLLQSDETPGAFTVRARAKSDAGATVGVGQLLRGTPPDLASGGSAEDDAVFVIGKTSATDKLNGFEVYSCQAVFRPREIAA